MADKLVHKRILLGCLVIFGIYFGVKGIIFSMYKVVAGNIQRIEAKVEYTPSRRGGSIRSVWHYPVFQFRVDGSGENSGQLWTANQYEVYSFRDYKAGDAIKVRYKRSNPQNAHIYSVAEYWFPLSNMLVLFFACAAWSAIYFFVHRFFTEGR